MNFIVLSPAFCTGKLGELTDICTQLHLSLDICLYGLCICLFFGLNKYHQLEKTCKSPSWAFAGFLLTE